MVETELRSLISDGPDFNIDADEDDRRLASHYIHEFDMHIGSKLLVIASRSMKTMSSIPPSYRH
jgi:hypothetical protein